MQKGYGRTFGGVNDPRADQGYRYGVPFRERRGRWLPW
jgi:hypothetical protein